MKKLTFISLFFLSLAASAQVKISNLPLGHANATTSGDSFPFVNSTSAVTEQMTLFDLINLPPFQSQFLTMIPSQSGQSGKFLSTNGLTTSWQTVAGAANQQLSNLTNPTAVNQNLIFNTGTVATIQTQNASGAITYDLDLQAGNVTAGSSNPGNFNAQGGNGTGPNGGAATLFGGSTSLVSGAASGGTVSVIGGGVNNSNTSATAGNVVIQGGQSVSTPANSGGVNINDGNDGTSISVYPSSMSVSDSASILGLLISPTQRQLLDNAGTVVGDWTGPNKIILEASTLQIQNGTQGTQYNVLASSDTNGTATWQTLNSAFSAMVGTVFTNASLFLNHNLGFNVSDGTINNTINTNAIDFVDSSCSNCLHIDADPATTVDITGPFLLEDNASGYHGNAVMVGNTSVRTLNASDGSTALNFFTPGVYSFGTGTVSSNNFLNQLTIFPSVSSSCVLTLTSASSQMYSITGPYGCVVNLPVVSTLQNGTTYILLYEGNSSTTNVNTSGGNLMATFNGFTGFNQELIATVIDNTAGTGLASWAFTFVYTDQTTAPITAVGGPMNANVTVGSPWQFDFGTNNRPIGNFYLKNIFLYDGSGDFIGEMAQGGGFTVGAQAGQNLILSTSDNGSGASNNINLHVGTASTAAGVGVVTVNTLLQLPVQTLGTAPANATNGSIALTSTYILCVYNGSGWVQTANGTVACTF